MREVPARGLFWKGPPCPEVPAERIGVLEPVREKNPRDYGARRVRTSLQDVEAAVLRAHGQPHGLLERLRDLPLPAHEFNPASELHPPRDVHRHEEPQDLFARDRPQPRLAAFDKPPRALVGDLARLLVLVPGVPEVDVLARHLVRAGGVVHAGCCEHDDEPVLERAHRPLDLPLRLRRRRDHVVDVERPAHAAELRAQLLALLPEHLEPVGVQGLRDAVPEERGLQHGEVLEKRLPFADAVRDHLPCRVVQREDDALHVPPRAPDVPRRRVVLVQLPVAFALPPAVAVAGLLPLDREHAAHERHEVPLAVPPHARAVAAEPELAGQLVRVELEVRPVLPGRLYERLQIVDALLRPVTGMVASRSAEEGGGLAGGEPPRPKVVELGPADPEGGDGVPRSHVAVVETADDPLDHVRAEARVQLLFFHAPNYRTCHRPQQRA